MGLAIRFVRAIGMLSPDRRKKKSERNAAVLLLPLHVPSRVQLDRNPPATPRFNMPFTLGLALF